MLSLEKDHTLKFYIKKYIRIEFPYLAAYFFMSFLMIMLALVNSNYFQATPLSRIITVGGDYFKFIPVLFGLDWIFNVHIDNLHFLSFTGEWFIGCVVGLYLISPILYFLVKNTNNIIFLIFFVLVSFFVYKWIKDDLNNPFWFFVCRIPEFALGMVIYKNLNFIRQRRKSIAVISIIIVGVYILIQCYADANTIFLADIIIPLLPIAFFVSFPIILILFIISHDLNLKFDFSTINTFSKYIYVVMLIQHVYINIFMRMLPYTHFSKFGYLFILFCIIFITFITAKAIVYIEKPFENFAVRKIFR